MDQRNHALEGFRGLAMLLVFAAHCIVIRTAALPAALPKAWVDQLFIHGVNCAWVGMHFFFALSGFLITRILLETKQQPRYYTNFYARRFLRIFPLYYALLAVAFFVVPHFSAARSAQVAAIGSDQWTYWAYLCNFTFTHAAAWRYPFVDIAWSLAVEEQFYIVWPVVVALLPLNRLFQLSCGLLFAACGIRGYLIWSGTPAFAIYANTGARFDAIAAGAVVAIAYRYHSAATARILAYPKALLGLSTLATAVLMFTLRGGHDNPPAQLIGHGVVALWAGALVLNLTLPIRSQPLVSFFENGFFRLVGKYSYGFYLLHLPVRDAILHRVYPRSAFLTLWGSELPGQLLFYLLTGTLVLAAAALSFHLFETPFLKLKRYFEYEKGASTQGAAPRALAS